MIATIEEARMELSARMLDLIHERGDEAADNAREDVILSVAADCTDSVGAELLAETLGIA